LADAVHNMTPLKDNSQGLHALGVIISLINYLDALY